MYSKAEVVWVHTTCISGKQNKKKNRMPKIFDTIAEKLKRKSVVTDFRWNLNVPQYDRNMS